MIEDTVVIINRLGLHARAAAKLIDCAAGFSSQISLRKNDQTVDAKSIMSVMLLAAGQGTPLHLTIDGDDEQAAHEAILALINDRFGESE
ncbi:MAG: HPr family phosphocarrier protein [Luminiphilus sp.]|nr:HPr family phosphocarrier protein [Luminiphilus sp.]